VRAPERKNLEKDMSMVGGVGGRLTARRPCESCFGGCCACRLPLFVSLSDLLRWGGNSGRSGCLPRGFFKYW